MAKGTLAKQKVAEVLKIAFHSDYVGESAGKYYVWADDGGEKVQIAIALTCPKNPLGQVDVSGAFGDGIDFDAPTVVAQQKFEPAEITEQEKKDLEELMKRLGL